MTFEELKAEADKQGYNLLKKQEKVKLLDCTCGGKRRFHWSKIKDWQTYEGLECEKCGKKVWAKTELEAKKAWNKLIESELNADK